MLKDRIYKNTPNYLQNFLITIYNIVIYNKRLGGRYKIYLEKFKKNNVLSLEELKYIQNTELIKILNYTNKNSSFYKELYQEIKLNKIQNVKDLNQLPIVTKEDLRGSLNKVYTISKKNGVISKTGGTTGKSLEVLFNLSNMQERFAMLDNFRGAHGYKLGKKTAWFSGKNLLTIKDITRNRFWKTDYWYNVRYYSTFHIKEDFLQYYIENLMKFKPEYMIGFPSNMLEIAKYGLKNEINFPKSIVKAIFPTAESITKEARETIESFFKTKIYDQYASSEGAPFIFECKLGNLHMELQSGVFEVLDTNNKPAKEGRLILTSFTSYGTPLIRYDIGDGLILSERTCTCGNNNPLVEEILGRVNDFIYSPETGKINLGNVSNTLKGTKGIIKFQAIQDSLDEVVIEIVIDKLIFKSNYEEIFIQNWRDRIGNSMKLTIIYVNDIMVEKSGKYRMVKNNIKHLINY
jgi:phenylacetate-CoA ligase